MRDASVAESLLLLCDFCQERMQGGRFLLAERAENLAFGLLLNLSPARVRGFSALGDDGEPRSSIVRVGSANHQTVRFQPVDELGDVRFDAGEAIRKLTQRQ